MKKTTVFITHDLDEAIRIGHRIAIMKDGRIVQIGRPEDIVLAPADDYVAEFVAGISRLKLVSAAAVMRPLPADALALAGLVAHAPRVTTEHKLDSLIDLSVQHEGPFLVTGADGAPAGCVDRVDLLKAVQGERRREAGAHA